MGMRASLGILLRRMLQPTHPARAGGWRERRAALDGGKGEREMWNENYGADGPGGEVVVQDVEVGSAVFNDGALHFGVGGVEDFHAKGFRLAF
jgi:hypothetical protein